MSYRRLHQLLGLLLGLWLTSAQAGQCKGEWLNPLSEICWDCVFPITLGSAPLVKGNQPDTRNPGSPVCQCPAPPPLFVSFGVAVGFWEPARLIDVTRVPYCFTGLGGMELDLGFKAGRGDSYSTDGDSHMAAWHAHFYIYPILYLLNIITDALCKSHESFDLAYMSEIDPTWFDDELGFLLNPEAVLFANLPAQAACAADCLAASIHKPLDALFWCAGCQGSMYPLGGRVQAHIGGIQSSLLVAQRLHYKLFRQLMAHDTSGPEALCGPAMNPIIEKSSFRSQLTFPVAMATGKFACNPYGRSTVLYETGKEFPVNGEMFNYLIWRKRNCCVRY